MRKNEKKKRLSKKDYHPLIAGNVDYWKHFLSKDGAIIDPFEKKERQYSTPAFALASALLAIEFARPLVLAAAWAHAAGAVDAAAQVSAAKVAASDAARLVARTALQCHGAIGYTTEYDLHLYMKRSWALARSWGNRAFHHGRVRRAIL